MKRKLSDDGRGNQSWFVEDDGVSRIVRTQDITAQLENNNRLRNDTEYSKQGIKHGWWHMAHIPNVVLEKWYAEGLIKTIYATTPEDMKVVKSLLNSRDYAYLKTTAGTV